LKPKFGVEPVAPPVWGDVVPKTAGLPVLLALPNEKDEGVVV